MSWTFIQACSSPHPLYTLLQPGHLLLIIKNPLDCTLTVNLRPPSKGVAQLLQHQHPRPLPHHKAIPVLVPRAAGGLGGVVAFREGLACDEATDATGQHGGIGRAWTCWGWGEGSGTEVFEHARSYTHGGHTHTRARTRTHTRTHTNAHARTHTNAHTHNRIC